jgi:lipopolysaccharide transport system ATP-binding protein
MSSIAITVEGLSKQYKIGGRPRGYRTMRESIMDAAKAPWRRLSSAARGNGTGVSNAGDVYWALRDVSFEIKAGDVVGVIGRNGAGKSTLLKILSRITEPSEGFAEIHGRVGSLLEVGTGFHGELSGRENIYLNGAILGMRRAEIDRQFDAIVAFAEVDKFIDTPVKFYSSGMYLRLAFAVAAHLEPEILLVDEVLAVGDMSFQKKCLGKMGEVAKQGRTVLFVSHNMGAVRSLCEKGLVLNAGQVVEAGPIGKSIETYYKLTANAEEEPDGTRSGFGKIKLADRKSMTIEQGDEFELSTSLHITSEVAGFTLMCLMNDMHQRPILHLRRDSSEFGGDGSWRGRHDIRLKLPPLWLEPGIYSVHFKIFFWGGDGGQQRYLSDVAHLDVGGENSCGGAVITPRVGWTVTPSQEQEAA